jgi:hypothetical protein
VRSGFLRPRPRPDRPARPAPRLPSWRDQAENLICDPDGTGTLWVTEAFKGILYAVTWSAETGYAATQHIEAGPFGRFLGLALHPSDGTLFAVGVPASGSPASQLIVVNKSAPNAWTVAAALPKEGNGLAFSHATGTLWSPTEDFFAPLGGAVFAFDPATGVVSTPVNGSFSDDGAWIDQARGIVYVSEVLGAKVLVLDVHSRALVAVFPTPAGLAMLDDFTLSADGLVLFGADFWNGNAVAFALPPPGTSAPVGNLTVLAGGLQNPTSVRWGCQRGAPPGSRSSSSGSDSVTSTSSLRSSSSSTTRSSSVEAEADAGVEADEVGFPDTSLFITEGGGIVASTTDRRVLRLDHMR